MKLKYTFVIREVVGELVAIAVGATPDGVGSVVRLKPGVAYLFQKLQQETTEQQLVADLQQECELPPDRAAAIVEKFLARMREQNLLDE